MIFAPSAARAAIVTSGLAFNLDASISGSYNGTTWLDQSGNGVNATQVNSPTYNAADGSFSFNGTNQYFNLGNVQSKTGAFSLEITFSAASLAGTPALVARQNTGIAGNYFLGLSSSKVTYYVESPPWGISGSSTLATNTKYVATMVYDASKVVTPYLNGALNGTATSFATALTNSSINLFVGAALSYSAASAFFNGKIYSVRMYDRALTASEVNQNYRSFAIPTISTPTFSGAPSKGLASTISVNSDSAGKVRYFLNGKRIAGCLAQATTGSAPTYTSTCQWRPTTQGAQKITAQLIADVGFPSSPISSPLEVAVKRRTTSR